MMFSLLAKKGTKAQRRNRAIMSVALMASAAFIALAIVGWDLPVSTAMEFLFIAVVLVGILIGAALLLVFIWHLLKKILS